MQFNINMDGAVVFTNKLEKLHKSALPNAIRTALNSTAFDVKKNTMPKNANKAFINRSKNFFKANSRVEMASGFKISAMKSMVGFISSGLSGENNNAVKDLEQQESGGTIQKKSFIPIKSARTGSSNTKQVRPINRLRTIKGIVNSAHTPGKNPRQKFIHAVSKAGVGGTVLSEYNGKTILWRVNSLKRSANGKLKLTALYSFKAKRSVKVDSTQFMEKSSLESNRLMGYHYADAAKKQIQRLIN